MATTADFKNGMCLDIDGNYFFIVEFLHVKPGKGPAFVRTKLKNVKTGRILDKTWNSGVKGDTATNTLKPATVETGAEVRVPLFCETGDKVRIDTRDGSYVERVERAKS